MSRADKCAAVARGRGWPNPSLFSTTSFANETFRAYGVAALCCAGFPLSSYHVGDSCRVIGAWPDTGDGTKSCCRIFGSGGVVSVLLAMCYGHRLCYAQPVFFLDSTFEVCHTLMLSWKDLATYSCMDDMTMRLLGSMDDKASKPSPPGDIHGYKTYTPLLETKKRSVHNNI